MKTVNILFAGFGGQGVLFAGKVAATSGLISGLEVSWLPSYGPEMRGGTANCSVVLSDEPIGCPIVLTPDILVAMNAPSYEKFENAVSAGGSLFMDSSLIPVECGRKDIKVYSVPATKMAKDNGLTGLANIILLGRVLKETEFIDKQTLIEALKKSVPPKKEAMLAKNMEAFELGYNS